MSRGATIARRIPGAMTALSVFCNFSQARRCIPLDNSVFSVSHNASLYLCISGWFSIGGKLRTSEAEARPAAQLEGQGQRRDSVEWEAPTPAAKHSLSGRLRNHPF